MVRTRPGENRVLRVALPPAVVLGAQLCANRIFTGDFSSAGALVKLEIKNPLLTSAQVLDAYWFHLKYQLFRVAEYHFTDNGWSVRFSTPASCCSA